MAIQVLPGQGGLNVRSFPQGYAAGIPASRTYAAPQQQVFRPGQYSAGGVQGVSPYGAGGFVRPTVGVNPGGVTGNGAFGSGGVSGGGPVAFGMNSGLSNYDYGGVQLGPAPNRGSATPSMAAPTVAPSQAVNPVSQSLPFSSAGSGPKVHGTIENAIAAIQSMPLVDRPNIAMRGANSFPEAPPLTQWTIPPPRPADVFANPGYLTPVNTPTNPAPSITQAIKDSAGATLQRGNVLQNPAFAPAPPLTQAPIPPPRPADVFANPSYLTPTNASNPAVKDAVRQMAGATVAAGSGALAAGRGLPGASGTLGPTITNPLPNLRPATDLTKRSLGGTFP